MESVMKLPGLSSDPVAAVLQARQAATTNEVNVAVARKQLDVQAQTGDAINQLLEQTALAAKQVSKGHLDVRV